MEAFSAYAHLYDSYYKDKEYNLEVENLLKLANQFGLEHPTTVLDMGCGTGNHLIPLAEKGLLVQGFDLSPTMVEYARNKIAQSTAKANLSVEEGDLTSYRSTQKFDLVISMFAVLSYLRSDSAFLAAMQTAAHHLTPNGLFVFDVWHGLAVQHLQPESRIQRFQHQGQEVIRNVAPKHDPEAHLVTVSYELNIGEEETIQEDHTMRYYFEKELKVLAAQAGLTVRSIHPVGKPDAAVSQEDWNITVVASLSSN